MILSQSLHISKAASMEGVAGFTGQKGIFFNIPKVREK
jgi:hypothetical protein